MSERDEPATAAHPSAGAGATESGAEPAPASAPEHASAPVAARRPDAVGSLLLLVAGLAAGFSLLLPWLAADTVTGLTLVKDGMATLAEDAGEVVRTGYVQPLTIVLGGGVLFLLGLLLLVPARSHRLVGLLALLVTLAVTLALLVPLSLADWDLDLFGIGFWFAIAVAVLGLLGAVEALVARRKGRAP